MTAPFNPASRPAYHFSIDDVLGCLLAASDSGQDLFENALFRFLQQLHARFGAEIHLYLFLEQELDGRRRSLTEVSERLRSCFREHNWLRMAPHALDPATPPHSQSPEEQQQFCDVVFTEIERIAGPDRISRWVRLHYFSESYELARYFREHGIEALLTTDKPAVSYRLPPRERSQLGEAGAVEYQGIHFLRSHLRIEQLVDAGLGAEQQETWLASRCPAAGPCVVFTHEYELARPEVREMTFRVLDWLVARGYGPDREADRSAAGSLQAAPTTRPLGRNK